MGTEMNSIELLSKQIESYQKQNATEHKELSQKIDRMLEMIHGLSAKDDLHEHRFDNLEEGQKEIKATVDDIDKRVKNLEEHERDRQQAWSLALKVLGVIATIGAIVGIVFKFV